MLTQQRGEPQHTDTLPDAQTWGSSGLYARNTAEAGQCIAPRSVPTPTARQQAFPLVRMRLNAEPRKGDAGNMASHTANNSLTPPATLRKAKSDDRPHA